MNKHEPICLRVFFKKNKNYLQGTLRGLDQNINVILEDCRERMFSMEAAMSEVVLGLFVVRGDNMYVGHHWMVGIISGSDIIVVTPLLFLSTSTAPSSENSTSTSTVKPIGPR